MKKKKVSGVKKDEQDPQLLKLGKRLRQLRIKKGFSNYEYFAYEHGLGRAQYGKYETGGNIRFDTLVKLVRIHGLTIKEFFSEGFD
jgi:transcriptional regulator with XRE-family HTH domain